MKMTGTQIIESLARQLQNDIGRHLYGIIGSYAQLESFERDYLPHLLMPEDLSVPQAINVTNTILASIADDDLRSIIKAEVNLPRYTQDKLNKLFDSLLNSLLKMQRIVVLKQPELLFAYELDLQILRTRATNNKHIILLLPGEIFRDRVELFTEARPEFHRTLPAQLITADHSWEIKNAG